MEKATRNEHKIDVYAVIAKEERRPEALAQIQQLRDRGYRIDYPLIATKVTKQFQAAEQLGASFAVIFGDEWPQVGSKDLRTGEQQNIDHQELLAHLRAQPSLSS